MSAIACQQLPRTVGIHLLSRLAQRYGPAISTSARAVAGFPAPHRLANADPSALRELGFSRAKATTPWRSCRTWSPYSGLVYFHLLLDTLAVGGHLAHPVPPAGGPAGALPPAGAARPQRRNSC